MVSYVCRRKGPSEQSSVREGERVGEWVEKTHLRELAEPLSRRQVDPIPRRVLDVLQLGDGLGVFGVVRECDVMPVRFQALDEILAEVARASHAQDLHRPQPIVETHARATVPLSLQARALARSTMFPFGKLICQGALFDCPKRARAWGVRRLVPLSISGIAEGNAEGRRRAVISDSRPQAFHRAPRLVSSQPRATGLEKRLEQRCPVWHVTNIWAPPWGPGST